MARLAAFRTLGSDQGDFGSHWEVMYTIHRVGLIGANSLNFGSFFTSSIKNIGMSGGYIHLPSPAPWPDGSPAQEWYKIPFS